MPSTEQVTFAIPFYSGVPYLKECLASVLAQARITWQALVCDDAGPGGDIAAIVNAQGEGRIRYHRNPSNLGMAGNWNRCLDLAGTDWVTLVHSDDRLLPNYVEAVTEAIERHPEATAFFFSAEIIDGQGKPTFSFVDRIKSWFLPSGERGAPIVLKGEPGAAALMNGNFIMCPTLCYRKSKLAEERFDGRWKMVLDLEFTTRLLMKGHVLVGIPVKAYAYRRHASNATSQYNADLSRFREESAFYKERARQLSEQGWNAAAAIARRQRIIRLHLLYRIAEDVLRLRFSGIPPKARLLRDL